jgi:hypothetical protein
MAQTSNSSGTSSYRVVQTTKYVIDDDPFDNTTYLDNCSQCTVLPTVLPAAQRIIAIGDIHGDYNLAVQSMLIAKVIDPDLNWIGGNTIVVQVGDQIDSCRPTPDLDCHNTRLPGDRAEDIKVMDFFDDMHKKAQRSGGAVYSLLGNHETMNTQGRMDYVSYANMHDFYYKDESTGKIYSGPQGRIDAFKPGGPIAIKLSLRPTVMTIGSNMFVHAGILPDLIEKIETWHVTPETKLKYLNTIVRKWLISKTQKDEFESIILSDPNLSPLWSRLFGMVKPNTTDKDNSDCYASVKKTLDFFKMGHMIVGHTPQIIHGEGINGTCKFNGRDLLYRVDGGFAESFGNDHKIQVLEILNDSTFNILEGTAPRN